MTPESPLPVAVPRARVATDLRDVECAARARLRLAAADVIDTLRALALRGESTIGAVVGRSAPSRAWQHYPGDDVEELLVDCTWYYHSHDRRDRGARAGEHGHFHVFARDGAGAVTHIAGLGVDARGLPVRLFATNAWVTGGPWATTAEILRLADRAARLRERGQSEVSRWIGAVLELFRPQLEAVLEHRDRRLAAWRAGGRGAELLRDRRIHVLSECALALGDQIAMLSSAHRPSSGLRRASCKS